MALIDKSSAIPYYHQLADLLREEIEERASEGCQERSYALPSEHELCKRYGISRATVRRPLLVCVKMLSIGFSHGLPLGNLINSSRIRPSCLAQRL